MKVLLMIAFAWTAVAAEPLSPQTILKMNRSILDSQPQAPVLLHQSIVTAHREIRGEIQGVLKTLNIEGHRFTSAPKNSSATQLAQDLQSELRPAGRYYRVGQIKDLVRGQIEVENLEQVKKVFNQLKEHFSLVDYILPYTRYRDYPRYHLHITHEKTGVPFQLKIGTRYTSYVQKNLMVDVSRHPKLRGQLNLNALWFQRLSNIKDWKDRRDFKLDEFESHYDELLVATGEGKPKNFDQRARALREEMQSIVNQISAKKPSLLEG